MNGVQRAATPGSEVSRRAQGPHCRTIPGTDQNPSHPCGAESRGPNRSQRHALLQAEHQLGRIRREQDAGSPLEVECIERAPGVSSRPSIPTAYRPTLDAAAAESDAPFLGRMKISSMRTARRGFPEGYTDAPVLVRTDTLQSGSARRGGEYQFPDFSKSYSGGAALTPEAGAAARG